MNSNIINNCNIIIYNRSLSWCLELENSCKFDLTLSNLMDMLDVVIYDYNPRNLSIIFVLENETLNRTQIEFILNIFHLSPETINHLLKEG